MTAFPEAASARDRFVLDRRRSRTRPDPWAMPRTSVEHERAADGTVVAVLTIFLVGKECAWRCTMCDLWQHTLEGDTPRGAIPWQVGAAWALRPAGCTTVKLYNAGSFFDPHAIPDDDYGPIADALAGASHVIVESHPSLIGPRTIRLRDVLQPGTVGSGPVALEVAMGLETCHPEALARLNKRMTAADVARAAERLRHDGIASRVFLLISPPFVPIGEQDEWLLRSVDAARAAGATAVSLIPTRGGNGALEALTDDGAFIEPSFADIERSLELALDRVAGSGMRVFADVWDLPRFVRCPSCAGDRGARLQAMNRTQRRAPSVACGDCGGDRRP
jgi:radical SAM enzyme (TIGR01210 family)